MMLEQIKSRYSCRSFKDEPIKEIDLKNILEAGRWAPSGLNNQPWKFIIIKHSKEIQLKLSKLTTSEKIIANASVNIVVLYDINEGYNRDKDIQGIGACIENMLLMADSLGYGTCWLGQILNRASEVLELLKLDNKKYELMVVISLGVPKEARPKDRKRKPLSELILSEL